MAPSEPDFLEWVEMNNYFEQFADEYARAIYIRGLFDRLSTIIDNHKRAQELRKKWAQNELDRHVKGPPKKVAKPPTRFES
jgi:hypothetical protein